MSGCTSSDRVRRVLSSLTLTLVVALALSVARAADGVAASEIGQVRHFVLRYRSAGEVLPLLRPMLRPGERIGGRDRDVVVRAAPERMASIAALIEAFDARPREFVVQVRQGVGDPLARTLLADDGRRAYATAGVGGQALRVRLVEDHPAVFSAGEWRRLWGMLYFGRALVAAGVQQRPEGAAMAVAVRLDGDHALVRLHTAAATPGADFVNELSGQSTAATLRLPLGQWTILADATAGTGDVSWQTGARLATGSRSGGGRVLMRIDLVTER